MNHRLIKARRAHLGYKVRDVTKRTGLANATVTAFERKGYDPKVSTFQVMARCYELDPSLLLNDKLKPSDHEFHLAVTSGAG